MTTEERVEKLEGELVRVKRYNRWVLSGAALGLGLVLVWAVSTHYPGQATAYDQDAGAGPKTIRANKFSLEDQNGKVRGSLAMDKESPGLWLFDEKGTRRAGLTVFKEGPVLLLCDESGKQRACLIVFKEGPALRLYDENGMMPGAELEVTERTGSSLYLFDKNGKASAALGANKESSGLCFVDEDIVSRMDLSVSQRGSVMQHYSPGRAGPTSSLG